MLYSAISNVQPQLDRGDLKIFKHYASLIFPGIELIKVENNDLREALIWAFKTHNYEVCILHFLMTYFFNDVFMSAPGVSNRKWH